ncbi:acyltransferase [Pseudomonas gingeri]|uniref:acyltransferase n=1 Tax=Pseudomonas gingeri TaxID=117681 RepID=UPI0015A0F1A4|nr:DapH/DapD/GlmU-related protein [Pseudomonas gingeri]NWA04467.1 transferase [Pseudomonas gingeri]NWA15556.1 transferase [Pseudomonas gingeri]NWA58272.1 transferase [Pseudomonas gingeri]NWA96052.1 transferase [Pseudomonas gingeri]NWB04586.1 transferase [Pseudomonas gingeri]
MIRHLINIILSLFPPSRLFAFRAVLLRFASVEIQANVKFCGRGWIYGRGRLTVGEGTWISPGGIFHTHQNADIRIGSHCDLGPGVEFILGSHEIGSRERRAGKGTARSIVVGNGCWIGAKSVILGGVTIGDGAIVAAGAIVTRDVPGHVLVAGVPAVVKRQLP